jgi:hypothetical protein
VETDSDSEVSMESSTEDSAAVEDRDLGPCADFIACMETVNPASTLARETYGSSGTCWDLPQRQPDHCWEECLNLLGRAGETHPDVEACGGDPTGGEEEPNEDPTYANVQAIFDRDCALGSCHDGTFVPDLRAGEARDSLVNVPSMTAPDGALLVERFVSAQSYLIRKLLGENIGGAQMPFGLPPLPMDEIHLIAAWIDEGAEG